MKSFILLTLGLLTLLSAADLTPSQVYTVSEINGQAIKGDHRPTIKLDAKTMMASGKTGVNGYGGSYAMKDGTILISECWQTQMAALDDNLNKTEALFMQVISVSLDIKQTETGILLSGKNGNMLLSIAPQKP